jgi:UPF0716 protein FxsA
MRGLFLVVLVVPIVEVLVMIKVAGSIGGLTTLLLVLGTCIIGGVIVRRVGARAWAELQQSAAAGRPPRDIVDKVIVLLGGVLLLVPGFITDAIGIVLLIPFTRRWTRRLVGSYVGRRVRVVGGPAQSRPSAYGDVIDGDVIEGEVVDDGDTEQKRDRPDQIGRAG